MLWFREPKWTWTINQNIKRHIWTLKSLRLHESKLSWNFLHAKENTKFRKFWIWTDEFFQTKINSIHCSDHVYFGITFKCKYIFRFELNKTTLFVVYSCLFNLNIICNDVLHDENHSSGILNSMIKKNQSNMLNHVSQMLLQKFSLRKQTLSWNFTFKFISFSKCCLGVKVSKLY